MKFVKKSTFVIIYTLAVFVINAPGNNGGSGAAEKIKQLEKIKNRINVNETILNNIKIKPRKSLWNFFERRGRERDIQKRNRIIRENEKLRAEKQEIIKKLLSKRPEFAGNMDKKAGSSEFRHILDYTDNLAARKFISEGYMPEKDINVAESEEFLEYKLSEEEKRAEAVKALIKHYKTKAEVYKEHKISSSEADFSDIITKLGDLYTNLKKSAETLRSGLNE